MFLRLCRGLFSDADSPDLPIVHILYHPCETSDRGRACKGHCIDLPVFQHFPDLLLKERMGLINGPVQRDIVHAQPGGKKRRQELLRPFFCPRCCDMAAFFR